MIIDARFSIDEKALSKALKDVIEATKYATDAELDYLREAGYIPNGVFEWLCALSKAGVRK